MINYAMSLLAFISASISVILCFRNLLMKLPEKNIHELKTTQIMLELGKLGIKKKEKVTIYTDYLRAENGIAVFTKETKSNLYILGRTLASLFVRKNTSFINTLEKLSLQRNITIKIILLDPESKFLVEKYRTLDILATLSNIKRLKNHGCKIEVRLTKEQLSDFMIFNETGLLFHKYSAFHEETPSSFILIKNKKSMDVFRKYYDNIWNNSITANI